MAEETGGRRDPVTLATSLGLGLVSGTLPLWLGPALFCASGEQYCGLGWLVWGALGLLVAGGLGAALGGGALGLAAGLVGVVLGTAIAVHFETLTHTLLSFDDLIVGTVVFEGLPFGIGYVVVWGLRALMARGSAEEGIHRG